MNADKNAESETEIYLTSGLWLWLCKSSWAVVTLMNYGQCQWCH